MRLNVVSVAFCQKRKSFTRVLFALFFILKCKLKYFSGRSSEIRFKINASEKNVVRNYYVVRKTLSMSKFVIGNIKYIPFVNLNFFQGRVFCGIKNI